MRLFVAKVIETVEKEKPDVIFVMGDILDRHETVHLSPFGLSLYFLREISRETRTVIIIGNHDRPNNSTFLTDEHAFGALKEWKNVTVVDTTTKLTLGDLPFVAVPYVSPGRFMEALDKVEWKDAKIVFAHQEIKGANMGSVRSMIGDHWSKDLPLLVSGHIHKYHWLGDNVLYVGTPLQHSYGEDTDKAISLLILDKEGKMIDHQRIDLGLPKKLTLTCAPADIPKECKKNTRVVITGTEEEMKAISKSPNVKNLVEGGVKVVYRVQGKSLKSDSRSYAVALYEQCQKNGLQSLFEELFMKPGIQQQT